MTNPYNYSFFNKIAIIQPDQITQDMSQNLQDINILEDEVEQEVAQEVATPQPNFSIRFKISDKQKKHQRLSNSIIELIDEMNKASQFKFQSPSILKGNSGKRISMKQLEELF